MPRGPRTHDHTDGSTFARDAASAADALTAASRISRRALLRAGAAAGATLAVAPLLRADRVATRLGRTGLTASAPAPSIVRRAAWGANEALRKPPAYGGAVEKLIVHHTGTANGIADWPAQVRRIYEFETAHGYTDIAYHYLVDPDGRIYEGRYAGPDPIGEDGNGHPVVGGHARAHNQRTLGVALLGNYTSARPSAAAVDALTALLAWQCGRWSIDPRGESRYVDDAGGIAMLPSILPHSQVRPTECPGANLAAMLPELRERVARHLGAQAAEGGYWVVSRNGREVAFGGVAPIQAAGLPIEAAVSGVATHPSGRGYWAYGPDGGVFAFGDAGFHGSLGGTRLNAPVAGMAPTPTGKGYWLASMDGGVFAFGDAPFLGSVAATGLMAPVSGIEAAPRGTGYWLHGADGGVFAFGDAPYHGSLAGRRLNAPIIGMAATRNGYWLVARDGGVFAFGDAPFLGSGSLGSPVVSMVPSTSGAGYLLLTADGQVLPFGDAPYHGSAHGVLPNAIGVAGEIRPVRK